MRAKIISRAHYYIVLLLTLFFFAAVSYQNCAPATFEQSSKLSKLGDVGGDSGSNSSSGEIGPTTGLTDGVSDPTTGNVGPGTSGTGNVGVDTAGSGSGGPGSNTSTSCSLPRQMVMDQCVCPGNSHYKDGTNACVECSTAEIWNETQQICIARCPSTQNWNGTQCITCASNKAWDGTSCVDITPECNSYQAFDPDPDEVFVVPARTTSKICYYIKLVNALSSRDSQQVIPTRTDITARDHDGETPFPRVMGTRLFTFALAGERQMLLAQNTAGTLRIRVDNFVLIEIFTTAGVHLWASGSADAPPTNGPLRVGGIAVQNYLVNAPTGGDNWVQPHDLRPFVSLNTTTKLRGSALDCGGTAVTSDIYLLFK